MTRWLRFLAALVAARGRSKLSITDESELSFRAWPTECDAVFMNNASFLTLCEAARLDFMVRSGLFAVARKRGWFLPMAAVHVQFLRPVKRLAEVKVLSRVAAWSGDAVWVEQKVMSGGKLAAVVIERGVFKDGRRTLPADEVVGLVWPGTAPREPSPWLEKLAASDAELRDALR